MGGDVVLSRNKSVTVQPQRGKIIELPAEGEKIKYIARADRSFDVYEVSTDDRGREPLNTDSTAYLALDHSNYRGETTVEEFADPLSVMLDLKVIKSKLPI